MAGRGLLMVFTGDGKGKTTAALGMALRAAGHHMRVLVLQFIKGAWRPGERIAGEALPTVEWLTLGKGFTWHSASADEDRTLACQGWEKALEALTSDRYDLIILDELNVVLSHGLLDVRDVLHGLRQRSPRCHVVITGRGAPEELCTIADCVTEMVPVKHHYGEQGIKAQKGIEF
ncbi:cob(I)yrinic acid a,c-diamide adenosyltransferase [Desulfosoma caldarium]|uniref:corrinoid adenosyltransferase n=1 Tax=Desulfosoma caldarium TaxID=610254 RepID=A0A3N1UU84_9BACT|nr:cob(I)yrinic acid a,c-diamide adenosyltransferase [Desulfosoma caldarium]ROQ92280.1 cob(I)yrinic acid a,c-diamide adenosyltransferase [Desulfosoma caldarium]